MKYGKMLFGHVKVIGLFGCANFIMYQEDNAFGIFALDDEAALKELEINCVTDLEHSYRLAEYRLHMTFSVEEALDYCREQDAAAQAFIGEIK